MTLSMLQVKKITGLSQCSFSAFLRCFLINNGFLILASEDHDQRVYLIKQTLKKLPVPNYILLKRLVGHFVM